MTKNISNFYEDMNKWKLTSQAQNKYTKAACCVLYLLLITDITFVIPPIACSK